jgi:hypothetical protein
MEATELAKKVVLIIVSICLVLCFSLMALADNKTVYIEYSREEGNNSFYPKVGFDWQINYNWGFAASHQFKVDAGNDRTTRLAIRRAFLDQELYWALNYETSKSYDSIELSANTFFPINDSLSYNGAVSYTTYSAHSDNSDNPDYNLLKILSGFQYKINNKLFSLISCEWSTYQYVTNTTVLTFSPDYSKLELSTGLGYQFNESFFIKGVYSWTDTKYEAPGLNKNWGEFILSANYVFKKYTFYLEYPFYQKDHTAMIGVAYAF